MKNHPTSPLKIIVISLAVIGIIALALGGYLTPVSRIVLKPLINAQTWLATRYQAIQSYILEPADVSTLRQRNTDLEAEIARLQVEIIELQQQVNETQVLSTLVDYARSRPENKYIAAAVIGRDPSPFFHYVIINRGSDDGLRSGMPAVTQQGLVGQIDSVTAGAARVQLINDPASLINVVLQQTTTDAVLVGSITGELLLEMIPQEVLVQPGELVVTSGLGGNYPPNLVIGQVSTIRRRDYDLFQNASVQSAVSFTQLEIVLVIVNFLPVDITPLIPTAEVP
ncbi:MAG: rod shape-determining protein MreC [Chloroflexi bacterium RBG_19FT_COMBO_47_9]|nr:MAG: rod shape-determining protein MreC [Chloroflexi bacterium RBG_19FT_COMBO_47_9]